MGNSTVEDWGIQVSIKHGPNLQYMTNIRGYTATEVAEHLEHLGDEAEKIQAGINSFLATETVKREFRDAEPVREREQSQSRYGDRGRPSTGGGGSLRSRDGEECGAHGLPMKYKSGRSKAGNDFELLECTAAKNPCDTIWPDKR